MHRILKTFPRQLVTFRTFSMPWRNTQKGLEDELDAATRAWKSHIHSMHWLNYSESRRESRRLAEETWETMNSLQAKLKLLEPKTKCRSSNPIHTMEPEPLESMPVEQQRVTLIIKPSRELIKILAKALQLFASYCKSLSNR